MSDWQYSTHALRMIQERRIEEAWVRRVTESPETEQVAEDGTIHYIASIPEYGGRYLRVVVNPAVTPRTIVTIFFDRRLRRRP